MFGHATLASVPTAYATASAGMHDSHTLPLKLKAISQAGFMYTEIAFPDLEAYTTSLYSNKDDGYKKIDDVGKGDVDKLLRAANDVGSMCEQLGLKVLTLMP
jgi:hypothetical protein